MSEINVGGAFSMADTVTLKSSLGSEHTAVLYLDAKRVAVYKCIGSEGFIAQVKKRKECGPVCETPGIAKLRAKIVAKSRRRQKTL